MLSARGNGLRIIPARNTRKLSHRFPRIGSRRNLPEFRHSNFPRENPGVNREKLRATSSHAAKVFDETEGADAPVRRNPTGQEGRSGGAPISHHRLPRSGETGCLNSDSKPAARRRFHPSPPITPHHHVHHPPAARHLSGTPETASQKPPPETPPENPRMVRLPMISIRGVRERRAAV